MMMRQRRKRRRGRERQKRSRGDCFPATFGCLKASPFPPLPHPYPELLSLLFSLGLYFRQEIEFVPQKSGIFTNFLFFQKVKDLTFLKNVKVFQKLRKKVGHLYKLMTTILSSNKGKQECRKLNNSVPLFFLGQKWDFGTEIIEKYENQTKIINPL